MPRSPAGRRHVANQSATVGLARIGVVFRSTQHILITINISSTLLTTVNQSDCHDWNNILTTVAIRFKLQTISNITHRVWAALRPCSKPFLHLLSLIRILPHGCGTARQQAPSSHASSDQNGSQCQRLLRPRHKNTWKINQRWPEPG